MCNNMTFHNTFLTKQEKVKYDIQEIKLLNNKIKISRILLKLNEPE